MSLSWGVDRGGEDLLLLAFDERDFRNFIYDSISSLVHCIHSSHLDSKLQSEPLHFIQNRCLSSEKLLILPWHFLQDRRVASPDVDDEDPEDLGGSEKCTSASVVATLNPGLPSEISITNSLTL